MERGREERKNLSSTSWGENLRQTVFCRNACQGSAAFTVLQIKSWQSINPEKPTQRAFY